MKRTIATMVMLACSPLAAAQIATIDGTGTASGNGNGGFGGVIGTGSLDVETLADGTVNITLNTGAGSLNDRAVIYIDSVAGGFSSTNALSDTGDDGRRAISGNGANGESSDLGFAPGFEADFAVTYEVAFSGLWDLQSDPANFAAPISIGTDAMRTAADASFGVSFNLADIGLTAGDSFTLVATYLNSGNAFRSGELIGSAASGPFPADPNIGQNGFSLGQDDFVLVNSIPAPGGVALLGFAGLAVSRRRRLPA
ncbi:MAG: hypothetical protein AAF235_12205 [Planctomycetota bacterium]